MRRSKVEVYLHFVWATKGRVGLLNGPLEDMVHRCVHDEATALGCAVLALGGMPDHVHLVVKAPGKVAPCDIARRAKGVSSRLASKAPRGCPGFAWQGNYGVFSLSRGDVKAAVEYVLGQREHHMRGTTWRSLEETDEEAEPGGEARGAAEVTTG